VSGVFPYVVLALAMAVWGGAFPAIKYLVEKISPGDLLILRFIPTSIIAITWIFVSYRKDFRSLFPRYWPLFLFIGFLWLYCYHFVLNIGETVLTAGVSGLIIATYPVFTVLISAAIGKESLTTGKIIGCMVAFAGSAFLTLAPSNTGISQTVIPNSKWIGYAIFTFIAPISAAVHTIIARPYLIGENRGGVKIDPLFFTLAYMAPGGLMSLVLYRPLIASEIASGDTVFWLSLGFLIFGCTLFSYIAWFKALKNIEAGKVAIFSFMVPVFSLIYSKIFLNEAFTFQSIIGAVCIIAGIAVSNIGNDVIRNGRNSTR